MEQPTQTVQAQRCSIYWNLDKRFRELAKEAAEKGFTKPNDYEPFETIRLRLVAHYEICEDCKAWFYSLARGGTYESHCDN